MHPRMTEISAQLEETRAAIVHAVAAVSPEDAARRPQPDAWSVDEILTHLSLVEPGVAKRIAKSVTKAKADGLERETSDASVLESLQGTRPGVVKAMVAPEFVDPKTVLPTADALASLIESRESLRAVMSDADGWALQKVVATHPWLGDIDMYQWMLFLDWHERRHLAQLERTIAAVGAS